MQAILKLIWPFVLPLLKQAWLALLPIAAKFLAAQAAELVARIKLDVFPDWVPQWARPVLSKVLPDVEAKLQAELAKHLTEAEIEERLKKLVPLAAAQGATIEAMAAAGVVA